MDSSSTKQINKSDDLPYAIAIIVVTVVLVICGIVFTYINNNKSGINNSGLAIETFTPPPERQLYIDAKEKLSTLTPSDIEDLKKLLMRRAFKSIPLLLTLQNEGNSIERLYKRGILTDDMHYRVKDLKTFFDQEFQDVQTEAEELVEGWGPNIWPQAIQYYNLVQKHIEDKAEALRSADEIKRKQANEKKREKEKAKKIALRESNQSNGDRIISLDPEETKALEAEKMAQLLIDEEEKEKDKKKSSKQNIKSKK